MNSRCDAVISLHHKEMFSNPDHRLLQVVRQGLVIGRAIEPGAQFLKARVHVVCVAALGEILELIPGPRMIETDPSLQDVGQGVQFSFQSLGSGSNSRQLSLQDHLVS
jgi:hypothetical protein